MSAMHSRESSNCDVSNGITFVCHRSQKTARERGGWGGGGDYNYHTFHT